MLNTNANHALRSINNFFADTWDCWRNQQTVQCVKNGGKKTLEATAYNRVNTALSSPENLVFFNKGRPFSFGNPIASPSNIWPGSATGSVSLHSLDYSTDSVLGLRRECGICGESMVARRVNYFLHPPINAEHEAGQAASTFFQFFGMTRPRIEPSLKASVARAQTTVPLSRKKHSSVITKHLQSVNIASCLR